MIDDWRKRAREKENNIVEELLVSHASYCIRYLDVLLFRLFRQREKRHAAGNSNAGPNNRACFHAELLFIS